MRARDTERKQDKVFTIEGSQENETLKGDPINGETSPASVLCRAVTCLSHTLRTLDCQNCRQTSAWGRSEGRDVSHNPPPKLDSASLIVCTGLHQVSSSRAVQGPEGSFAKGTPAGVLTSPQDLSVWGPQRGPRPRQMPPPFAA